MRTVAPLLVAVARFVSVSGHGLMFNPVPRAGTTEAGNNKVSGDMATPVGPVDPCGDGALLQTKGPPSANASVQAGGLMNVEWSCNLVHNGKTCQIKASTSREVIPGTGTPPKESFFDVSGEFTCCVDPGNEVIQVRMPPGTEAGPAVLQWTWAGDSMYYNCADITIAPGGVPGYVDSGMGFTNMRAVEKGPNGLGLAVGLLIWVPAIGFLLFYHLRWKNMVGDPCHPAAAPVAAPAADDEQPGGEQQPALELVAADGDLRTGREKVQDFWEQFTSMYLGPIPLFPYLGHVAWFCVLVAQVVFSILLLLALATDPGNWAAGARTLRTFNCLFGLCIPGLGAVVLSKQALSQFGFLYDLGINNMATFNLWCSHSFKVIAAQLALIFIGYITDASEKSQMDEYRVTGKHEFTVATELFLFLVCLGSFVIAVGASRIDWETHQWELVRSPIGWLGLIVP